MKWLKYIKFWLEQSFDELLTGIKRYIKYQAVLLVIMAIFMITIICYLNNISIIDEKTNSLHIFTSVFISIGSILAISNYIINIQKLVYDRSTRRKDHFTHLINNLPEVVELKISKHLTFNSEQIYELWDHFINTHIKISNDFNLMMSRSDITNKIERLREIDSLIEAYLNKSDITTVNFDTSKTPINIKELVRELESDFPDFIKKLKEINEHVHNKPKGDSLVYFNRLKILNDILNDNDLNETDIEYLVRKIFNKSFKNLYHFMFFGKVYTYDWNNKEIKSLEGYLYPKKDYLDLFKKKQPKLYKSITSELQSLFFIKVTKNHPFDH